MKIRLILLPLCGLGLLLSGCGGASGKALEKPYSFEERTFELADLSLEESQRLPLFAADLCVVSDEEAYDSSDVDSEAGLLCPCLTIAYSTAKTLLSAFIRPVPQRS